MQALRQGTPPRARRPSWLRFTGEVGIVAAAAVVDLLVWDNDNSLRGGQTVHTFLVPVATLIFYPFLLLRWRHSQAVFALHWIYSLAGVLMPLFAPIAGLLVALYAVARKESSRIARVALVVCLVPFVVNSYNLADTASEGSPIVNFMVAMVLWSVFTLTVWGLGRLAWAAERHAEQDKREQAAAAVRAERLHLARELHDIISHSVSAMILQAAGARTLASSEDGQVGAALKAIETSGIQAMDELHRLLGLLRVVSPTEAPVETTSSASLQDLDTLVSSTRASGVKVDVVVEGHPIELDRSVELAAYRIVQEALTNTIKYAGRGASSRVHLRWETTKLTVTVRDRTGLVATQPPGLSSGHGLIGLKERIALVGGTLEAGPVADGFLVQAHLPIRPQQHQASPAD